MAYQSEIELRVKVLDKELDELERRLKNIQNPFDVSGKRKRTPAQAAAVRSQIAEADLIRRSIEDLDRLREAKAEKRLRTNIRRVRYLRSQRIAAVRQVERAEDQLAKKRRDAVGSGIIGGAFPLLFGQGAGAAVGGGLGGAAGGLIGGQFGFGLSLVGTALGTAVDTFVTNTAKIADSLGDPTAALDALEESGIKVDKALKDNVKNLVETGEAYAAQSLVLEEINKNLGPEAVDLLSAYDAETQKLNDLYQQLSRELNAQLLPALVGTVVVFRQLTKSITDFFESPFGQGFLKGITINPNTFLAVKQFEFLTQTGREAAAQQAGRVIPLDPSVKREQEEIIERRNKAIRREQIAHERQLARLEKDRVRSQQKALQDRRKVLLDLLSLEQKINDLTLERIREEGRRLEKQRQSEVDLYKTRIQFEREKMRRISEVEDPLVAVNKRLQSLEKINEAEEALFALERSRAELEAERANPATLANVIEMYTKLSKLREDEYLAEKQALEASKERLMIYGTMASLSAAAGFQVSGDPRGAFVPKDAAGILKGIAGPSFEDGAELNAIVKQEVALERVLEKYQEIGQAAQLTSELVTTGFQDMLTGTKSAEEVFANFLRNLAEMLIKTAQQMIAQYIAIGIARAFALGKSPAVGTRASDFNLTGFGPLDDIGIAGFANGGNPPVGRPSIVGERGPELFVPSNSGTIVPNHALGGDVNVVVNVTETQTDTRGNGARANQVGNALAAAVQAEIIKQKRPGGLLAN